MVIFWWWMIIFGHQNCCFKGIPRFWTNHSPLGPKSSELRWLCPKMDEVPQLHVLHVFALKKGWPWNVSKWTGPKLNTHFCRIRWCFTAPDLAAATSAPQLAVSMDLLMESRNNPTSLGGFSYNYQKWSKMDKPCAASLACVFKRWVVSRLFIFRPKIVQWWYVRPKIVQLYWYPMIFDDIGYINISWWSHITDTLYCISHDDILMSHDIEGRSQVPSICFGSTWLHERGFVPDLRRGAALRVQWLECFWNVMLLQKWSEKGAFDHYRYHCLIFSNMF